MLTCSPDDNVYDVVIPTDDDNARMLMMHIWPSLQPQWMGRHVICQRLSGGLVNDLRVYYVDDDVTRKDALVVRLFADVGIQTPRDREVMRMQAAHYAGCHPEVRAILGNGVIYRYAVGRRVTEDDLVQPDMIKRFARSLAQLHWTDVSHQPIIDCHGKTVRFQVENDYLKHAKLKLSTVPHHIRVQNEELLIELHRELDFVEAYLPELDLPVAYTHDDMDPGNMLYNDETGAVTYLDFEFGGNGNYAVVDLAFINSVYHFADVWVQSGIPREPTTAENTRHWVRAYLQKKYEMEGRHPPQDVLDAEVELWVIAIAIMEVAFYPYRAARHLHLMLNPGVPATSAIRVLRKLYFEGKAKLAGMKGQYLKLKAAIPKC